MIEKTYPFKVTGPKAIEKIIDEDHVAINHMVLGRGDRLPRHNANSNVYMVVVRGAVTLGLDDQAPHRYQAGSIVNIPYDTRMDVINEDEETLEMFVVKAPGPKAYTLIK